MRLSEDFSNIEEFAYFSGGMVSPTKTHAIREHSIFMPDGHIIHAGYYALSDDKGVHKWYPWDFEKLFEPGETIEQIPAGWTPYPADLDESVFGVHVPVTEAEYKDLDDTAGWAAYKVFGKKKYRQELVENPIYKMIQEALEMEELEPVALRDLFRKELVSPNKKRAGYVRTPTGIMLVMGYSTSKDEVHSFLNRKHYGEIIKNK